MLSRNTTTVRAMAPISSRALVSGMRAAVSPSASRFITRARPSSGRVIVRPMRLAEADADQHDHQPDPQDEVAGTVATGERLPRLGTVVGLRR